MAQSPGPSPRVAFVLNWGPFPPPAFSGFGGTTNLSVTPGRPACPSRASGWSSLATPRGFPCCVRFPCVHAAATTPAQRLGVLLRSFPQPYQPSPKGSSGRPAHRPFRGLLDVHSRYGLHTRAVTVYRDTLSEGFSHFVTSMTAPVASGWSGCRVGLAPTGKRRLFTAHAKNRLAPNATHKRVPRTMPCWIQLSPAAQLCLGDRTTTPRCG